MGYVVAKYIRLSMEDAKSDSYSIDTQRSILDKYISKMAQDGLEVLEFVDNGYTGTNLDRPQFQKLMDCVQTGQVDCIVVKDFSRFGRDLVDMGYLIEQVLPMFRVRFVSLGDSYDSSQNPDGIGGGADVPFKFLVNELYSKDLSQKIRDAKAARTRNGTFVTKNCVYGYKLDKDRSMVVDPVAAGTVRQIFDLALQGKKPNEIARLLYMERRLSPGAYKGHKGRKRQNPEFDCVWDKGVIYSILRNEQYIGMYVAGKTTIPEVASKKAMRVKESEWVKIPNHHPPIIGKHDFDAVQAMMLGKRRTQVNKQKKKNVKAGKTMVPVTVLKGKVFCGHCNHALRPYVNADSDMRCAFTLNTPDISCHGLSIRIDELEGRVLALIQKQLRDGFMADSESTCADNAPLSYMEKMQQFHELFMAGEIDRTGYKKALAELGVEKHRLKIAAMTPVTMARMEIHGNIPAVDKQEIAKEAMSVSALTAGLVDALIEKVLVHPDSRLEICWKQITSQNRRDGKVGIGYAG